MSTIAIITARGGSKRIPRKNIKPFLGKPMLVYSIEAALKSGIFDEVMVSTDDEEIAQIAKDAGASVPFLRSEKTANDFATTSDVILEVLEEYQKRGREFEAFCCIYPTAPFITPQRLKEGMEILKEKKPDSVMPVVSFSFPPQRCVVIQDEHLVPKWPENMPKRSQDLEPYYHDCGQFYCVDTKRFLEERVILMPNTYPLILSELEVQDIDNEVDWKLAELKYRLLHENN
ncbi:MAG: pseudaminic acid cytidylyltransferase [Clostridiales bacterium]|nr:pseudaminic acid cytidylyltransferase [Clostridiales bacterium]